MPFSKPTLQEIIDRIKSDIQSRLGISGTLLRNSMLNILAIVFGGANHLVYDYITYMKDQLFVTSADSRYLEALALEFGISRVFGTAATGTTYINGTAGVTVPAGSRIESSTGLAFTTDAANVMTGVQISCAITSEEIGDEYNIDASGTLSFISPIAGVNTDTTIISIGGGTDTETDDALRERVLTRKRQPLHGGIENDFATWPLEVSGVTRAWAFPLLYGIGTIGVAFVYDGRESIIPTTSERAAMSAYIISHTDTITGKIVGAPVTAEPGLFILPLELLAVNFNIQVEPYNSQTVTSIQSQLEDLMVDRGGPEEEITISQMYEAITNAVGEEKSLLISPDDDVVATSRQVHVLGDVTISSF